MKKRILIVDDDLTFLASMERMLSVEGFEILKESNPVKVSESMTSLKFDVALCDIKMPGLNGIDLMLKIKEAGITSPIIFISGESTISIAVEAIKLGAYDFVEKPVAPERLLITLQNAIKASELLNENKIYSEELKSNFRIVGESKVHKELINEIIQIAPTMAKVLIQGESGTGKELVAWALHYNSPRKSKPYIKLNCAAIPSELLESELFGYTKGSFTGAECDKVGKFVAADGGSLFLDEIGDMSLPLQAKLLRALEENEVEVIGETSPRKVDVRIISATNKDLTKMVEEGKFRADLYHRLNVINLNILPLRERKVDVIPLAYFFIRTFAEIYNKKITSLSRGAELALLDYDYPGNVRELKNIIEKAVIYAPYEEISMEVISKALGKSGSDNISHNTLKIALPVEDMDLKDARKEFEKEFIIKKLNKTGWKIAETANLLGIDRTNLFRKMKELGIEKLQI